MSFDIDNSVSSVGTFGLGGICDISSTQVDVPAGSTTTIVGIASTYRSSKVLVEYTTNDGRFGSNELNVIHDGTTVDVLEYGNLNTGLSILDMGTYSRHVIWHCKRQLHTICWISTHC